MVSDFKYFFVFFFFLFSTDDRCSQFDKADGLISPQHQWRRSITRGPRILSDLVCTHFLPTLFCFIFQVSFCLSNLYLSSNTQARGARFFLFWLDYAFYWENIKYKLRLLRCASARLAATSAWFIKLIFQNREIYKKQDLLKIYLWEKWNKCGKNKKNPSRFCWKNIVQKPTSFSLESFLTVESLTLKFSFPFYLTIFLALAKALNVFLYLLLPTFAKLEAFLQLKSFISITVLDNYFFDL